MIESYLRVTSDKETRKRALARGSAGLRPVTVFRRENGGDPSILWGFLMVLEFHRLKRENGVDETSDRWQVTGDKGEGKGKGEKCRKTLRPFGDAQGRLCSGPAVGGGWVGC